MRRIGSLSTGALIGGSFFVTACGLFRVNVNGEEHTLGGNAPGQTIEAQPANEPQQANKGTKSTNVASSKRGSKAHRGTGGDENKDVKRATRDLIRDLDKSLRDSGGALPDDKLADLASKKEALASAGLADDAAYAGHVLTYYRAENAFRADASATADTLAKLLDGAVTTKGDASGSGKPLTFKFKAEAGKCYTVFAHLKNAGGDDDHMNDFFLDAGKDNGALERFTVRQRTVRGPGMMYPLSKAYTNGACAIRSADVTASFTLSYAGTTIGLNYVVVEHAREKLPAYIALEAEPVEADACDVEGFSNMWMNPVPGTVLYGREAPFIPYDIGPAEEMWTTSYAADGGDARIKREDFATQPPKQFKFAKDYHFKGCPKDPKSAHSPDGVRVAQCWDALDRRYNPQFDAANNAKNNAIGIMAEVVADNRITALNNAYQAEADRTCEKLSEDVGKKMTAAYNKVVDFYQATPYVSPFDRAALLKSTYLGVSDVKCVDASGYCTL